MNLENIKDQVPTLLINTLKSENIIELRPSQEKAINAGLLENKSLLVCTPTASGKTLIAEIAAVKNCINRVGKAVYVVPLKALANEKYKEFKRKYPYLKIALSIGDNENTDHHLADYDIIVCTAEKLDSLLRHQTPWVSKLATIILDEIHLLNDPGRGPTMEIIITILKTLLPNVQLIALSATIGNPRELAEWLHAELVIDDWRPVPLEKGIYWNGKIKFEDKQANLSSQP